MPAHSLPPFHQSDLVLDEEAVAEFPTGLWRFSRDEVNLFIPCVRGPRRTWAAKARDSTSPRHHGSSPGPVPPPPSRRDLSPDFSLTAATASLRPALRAGWSAERRPAADWPPRLFVWPHFPPLRLRPLPIGQEKWNPELICQNS